MDWVYESWDSEEPERPVCRSTEVHKQILAAEADLKAAMDNHVFELLDETLKKYEETDLDVRLRHKGDILNIKLMHELKISIFLKEKYHHDNYKHIRKDVQKVNDLLGDAYALDIDLDKDLV